MSSNVTKLYKQFSRSGIDNFISIDLSKIIEEGLSDDPFILKFHCKKHEAEGIIEFDFIANKVGNVYEPNDYLATFVPYPDFSHGVFLGINSLELEKRMKEINWNDTHSLFMEDDHGDPLIRPYIQNIVTEVQRLAEDRKGLKVSNYLQIKYFNTEFGLEDYVSPEALEAVWKMPHHEKNFPIDFKAQAAYNLFCGRAVLSNLTNENDERKWMHLCLNDDIQEVILTEGYGEGQIQNHIDRLPLLSHNDYNIRLSLMRGDITEVMMKNYERLFLKANPEEQTLQLYTRTMKRIPFDFASALSSDEILKYLTVPGDPQKSSKKVQNTGIRNNKLR